MVGGSDSFWRSPAATQESPSRRTRPSSTSMDRSCSAKSGLPSAACTIRSLTSAVSDPTRLSTTCALSSSESGSSAMRAPAASAPHNGRCSSSSRAGRANEEDRGLQRLGDPLDQVEERGLPPVNVFEEDDEWFLLGERLEELARAPEKLLDRQLLLGEADGGGDALQRIAGAGETGCKLASGDVRRIVLADTRYLANHLGQRPESGHAASVGQTTAACSPRAVLDVLRELLGEAGLAEPGCREDGDEPARALRDRLLELAGEACELTLASDQRPAVGAAVVAFLPHGEYAVGGHGLRLALELGFPTGSTSTVSRTSRYVDSPMRIPSGGAACSSRAATLTTSPVASACPPVSPATTSPVFTPVRWVSRTPQRRWSSVQRLEGRRCRRQLARPAARSPRGRA